MIKKAVLTAMAVVVIGGSGAYALTMDEAVARALENNRRIRQFDNLERASSERADSLRAPFWPSLDTEYSFFRRNKSVFFQGNSTSTFTVEASYNLFNGTSDIKALREAESRALASAYQRKATEADVVLEARVAYIGVLRAKRALETAEESVGLLKRQRRDNSLYYREGLIAKNELLKVEVELASARQDLLQAQGDLRVARKRLQRVMGVRIGGDEEIQDIEAVPEIADFSFEALRRMVLEQRSELKYLEALGEAEGHRLESIKGGYLPRVDLTFGYTSYGDEYIPDGDKELFGSELKGTVTATWNIFDGFRKRHQAADARYTMMAAQEELKDTEAELVLQLQEALEDYRVAAGKLRTAETAVGQAEENYRVTENRFRQRVATTTDLLDARFFLTRARNQLNSAIYDVHTSLATIERVVEREPVLGAQ